MNHRGKAVLIAFVVAFPIAPVMHAHGQQSKPHDVDFWRSIAKNHYALPQGETASALIHELSGYLGSPDPELRDELAYPIIAAWIVTQKRLAPAELIALTDEWRASLRAGVGEMETDSVLKRSFSALCLEALAERDLSAPFLGKERYRALLNDALAYLKAERDTRGFDVTKGWIHATAHTADLLTALAVNPLFRTEDQLHVLEAVAEKLSSVHEIFTFGEQDRLANAVAKIVSRDDFDLKAFRNWLTKLDSSDNALWRDSPPRLNLLVRFENDNYMLRALALRIYLSKSSFRANEARKLLVDILSRR